MNLEICEPPEKKERLIDEVEMLNYEIPVQIDVPDAADAEIDPLMPVEQDDQPGFVQMAQPIKSEPEIKVESPVVNEGVEADLPEIVSVISKFVLPERGDIYISRDKEVEEITIEPKKEVSRDNSGSAGFELDGPENQQRAQQHAPENQYDVPILKTQLKERLGSVLKAQLMDQLQLSDPACGLQSLASQGLPKPPASASVFRQAQQAATDIVNSMEQKVQEQFLQPSSATPPSHQDPPTLLTVEPTSVSKLLETPFLSNAWTNEQRNAIIKSSRPKPSILRGGQTAEPIYNEIPWLCGSSMEEFYCWPCLLFFYPSIDTFWSFPASQAALKGEFHKSCETHESSFVHQAAEKTLKIWLERPQNNKNCMLDLDTNEGYRTVRENRKLLSLLVQSICYLKKERHAAQVEDYAECFAYVVQSNDELQRALAQFQGESEKSSMDFVIKYANLVEDAVREFLKSKVTEEIRDARFVTLFMEDLSTIVEKSTVAVIGHFLDCNGTVQERVLELIEMGLDRSAAEIFTLFQNIASKFGLRPKIAGFTYSATVVHPSEIAAFNDRVERLCPVAKPFHYQRHNLARMLFGALSHLNCRNFFFTITEVQEFFKNRRISAIFEEFNFQSPYGFDCGFITTLKRCYTSVLETFSCILEHPGDWDDNISLQAPMLMNFLREFNTRFMITLIYHLNLATVDVSQALQGRVDAAEWKLLIRRAVLNLANIKKYGFKDIYLTALSPVLVKENKELTSDFPANLVAIFNEVIDTAVLFLRQRFESVDFGYVDLETVAQRYYSRLNLRPKETDQFRNQIQYLAKVPMIKDKSLAETLKFFCEHNLSGAAPEYATFLNFAMTIPTLNSCLSCPAVERILNCRRRSCQPPKDPVWMEKELLAGIFSQKTLTEAVINIFVSYQNTKEFSYPDIGDSQDVVLTG